ncbi:conserved Plasmodium protein, unknown function [Plasmodium chabaudi chabaudi]|uniref:Uncharacterized protein n=1 Tax=Plasmodium chabaudi chabaudi TaxID=31271 RepID=A0A4V0K959_PLACU|nr:conserved Plasmodium protein, unknown function [Plasmodium chabaudi chabaudi]VTZ69351.1 conserved Plasmodium protein, unknown function [Plasmodium chabaudi chabaudi]|eukprot:XP_016654058.1 conserved Plasmodium protein, unknown function [Plasmodium chabaudi chabaudi]
MSIIKNVNNNDNKNVQYNDNKDITSRVNDSEFIDNQIKCKAPKENKTKEEMGKIITRKEIKINNNTNNSLSIDNSSYEQNSDKIQNEEKELIQVDTSLLKAIKQESENIYDKSLLLNNSENKENRKFEKNSIYDRNYLNHEYESMYIKSNKSEMRLKKNKTNIHIESRQKDITDSISISNDEINNKLNNCAINRSSTYSNDSRSYPLHSNVAHKSRSNNKDKDGYYYFGEYGQKKTSLKKDYSDYSDSDESYVSDFSNTELEEKENCCCFIRKRRKKINNNEIDNLNGIVKSDTDGKMNKYTRNEVKNMDWLIYTIRYMDYRRLRRRFNGIRKPISKKIVFMITLFCLILISWEYFKISLENNKLSISFEIQTSFLFFVEAALAIIGVIMFAKFQTRLSLHWPIYASYIFIICASILLIFYKNNNEEIENSKGEHILMIYGIVQLSLIIIVKIIIYIGPILALYGFFCPCTEHCRILKKKVSTNKLNITISRYNDLAGMCGNDFCCLCLCAYRSFYRLINCFYEKFSNLRLKMRPNHINEAPFSHQLRYKGRTDIYGKPHGYGEWIEDHSFGEKLRGFWFHGYPVGPFISQEVGTGSLFVNTRVGFAACIGKDWSDVRYGVSCTECSISGHFFNDFPLTHFFNPKIAKNENGRLPNNRYDIIIKDILKDTYEDILTYDLKWCFNMLKVNSSTPTENFLSNCMVSLDHVTMSLKVHNYYRTTPIKRKDGILDEVVIRLVNTPKKEKKRWGKKKKNDGKKKFSDNIITGDINLKNKKNNKCLDIDNKNIYNNIKTINNTQLDTTNNNDSESNLFQNNLLSHSHYTNSISDELLNTETNNIYPYKMSKKIEDIEVHKSAYISECSKDDDDINLINENKNSPSQQTKQNNNDYCIDFHQTEKKRKSNNGMVINEDAYTSNLKHTFRKKSIIGAKRHIDSEMESETYEESIREHNLVGNQIMDDKNISINISNDNKIKSSEHIGINTNAKSGISKNMNGPAIFPSSAESRLTTNLNSKNEESMGFYNSEENDSKSKYNKSILILKDRKNNQNISLKKAHFKNKKGTQIGGFIKSYRTNGLLNGSSNSKNDVTPKQPPKSENTKIFNSLVKKMKNLNDSIASFNGANLTGFNSQRNKTIAQVFAEEDEWENYRHHHKEEIVVDGWQPLSLKRNLNIIPDEIVIYIHGYNVRLHHGCSQLAHLVSFSKLPSYIQPFVFHWEGSMWGIFSALSYPVAKKRSEMAILGDSFKKFIQDLINWGIKNVHIISHSCGSRLFFNGFASCVKDGLFYNVLKKKKSKFGKHRNSGKSKFINSAKFSDTNHDKKRTYKSKLNTNSYFSIGNIHNVEEQENISSNDSDTTQAKGCFQSDKTEENGEGEKIYSNKSTQKKSKNKKKKINNSKTKKNQIIVKTIILLNPDYSLDKFLETDFFLLRSHCNHIVMYGDTRDQALRYSETWNREKCLGKSIFKLKLPLYKIYNYEDCLNGTVEFNNVFTGYNNEKYKIYDHAIFANSSYVDSKIINNQPPNIQEENELQTFHKNYSIQKSSNESLSIASKKNDNNYDDIVENSSHMCTTTNENNVSTTGNFYNNKSNAKYSMYNYRNNASFMSEDISQKFTNENFMKAIEFSDASLNTFKSRKIFKLFDYFKKFKTTLLRQTTQNTEFYNLNSRSQHFPIKMNNKYHYQSSTNKKDTYYFSFDKYAWLDMDVIDTTFVETNVDFLKHSFYQVKREIIDDIREILISNVRAHERVSRLDRRRGNVYVLRIAPAGVGSLHR